VRLKLPEGFAEIRFGLAGDEESEGKTELLDQVANDSDDFILDVEAGAFV